MNGELCVVISRGLSVQITEEILEVLVAKPEGDMSPVMTEWQKINKNSAERLATVMICIRLGFGSQLRDHERFDISSST